MVKIMMKSSDYVSISKKIVGTDLLVIDVDLNKKNIRGLKWSIKVKDEKSFIFDSGYTDQLHFEIPIKHLGKHIIFVQCKVNSKLCDHFRDSIWVYSDNQKTLYNEFYNNYVHKKTESLPLQTLIYPYQIICALYVKDKEYYNRIDQSIKQINPDLNITYLNQANLILISEYTPSFINNRLISYSGKARCNDKFVYGQKDIIREKDLSSLVDEVGYFSVFLDSEDKFIFDNDYFGTYPLYTYQSDNIDIVSNSFHIIALITKHLGLQLTLNVETTIPYFVTGKRMLFEQLASNSTPVNEIVKVPMHKKCIFTSEGLTLIEKEIGYELSRTYRFNWIQYFYLIRKSARDIIHNINLIINDSRVKNIIVDVSGGKDSRTVLGGVLRCDYASKNVFINSKDVKEKKDKDSFIPLNHINQIPYDNRAIEYTISDFEKRINGKRSICLGTSFNYSFPGRLIQKITNNIDNIRLTGAGGDMLFCPYFPMSFEDISYDNTDTLSKSLAVKYNNGIINYGKIKNYIIDIIHNGIEDIPGRDLYEKFDNYYLYFRNIYHFGPEVMLSAFEVNEEKWTPLYSKYAFKLRQLCLHKFKGIRIAIDIIKYLRPQLLEIPFNTKEYNDELKKVLKSIRDNSDINFDDTEWRKANTEKENNRVIFDNDINENKNKIFKYNFYDEVLERLNLILHYDSNLEDVLGLDLFIFLLKHKNEIKEGRISDDVFYIINKITMVYDIVNIIKT